MIGSLTDFAEPCTPPPQSSLSDAHRAHSPASGAERFFLSSLPTADISALALASNIHQNSTVSKSLKFSTPAKSSLSGSTSVASMATEEFGTCYDGDSADLSSHDGLESPESPNFAIKASPIAEADNESLESGSFEETDRNTAESNFALGVSPISEVENEWFESFPDGELDGIAAGSLCSGDVEAMNKAAVKCATETEEIVASAKEEERKAEQQNKSRTVPPAAPEEEAREFEITMSSPKRYVHDLSKAMEPREKTGKKSKEFRKDMKDEITEPCKKEEEVDHFDVTQHVYEHAKNIWSFGKGVFLVKSFLNTAETVVSKAVSMSTGMELTDVDQNVLKPSFVGFDEALLNPAINNVVHFLMGSFTKSEEVVKSVLEPVVGTFLIPLGLLKNENANGTETDEGNTEVLA